MLFKHMHLDISLIGGVTDSATLSPVLYSRFPATSPRCQLASKTHQKLSWGLKTTPESVRMLGGVGAILTLEGPTRKPRHASVFSTRSDTQAVPAFHCMLMFKGIFFDTLAF